MITNYHYTDLVIQFLLDPFTIGFMQRALIGGVIVAVMSALVGVWVVMRGMSFLGEAMSHGMLPGIAIASLLGGNLILGAGISGLVMAYGVGQLRKARRVSSDTSIGLLFVAMLSIGVIIISSSKSFAVDLTGFLFGDVLAITQGSINYLLIALAVAVIVSLLFHRNFVALSFDERKAHTLGMRPKLTNFVLLVLITLSISASFTVVGTLLSFGLLIAPAAASLIWAKHTWEGVIGASIIGALSIYVGLLISWYASTAAGATIALTAVGFFFVSLALYEIKRALQKKRILRFA
jgi:zinc/manganese transport system permease protein